MATPLNNSVRRAFDILRLFGDEAASLSASDIARRLDLTVATAHRFILTLEQLGALVREGQLYRLGMLMAELGDRVEHDPVLAGAVRPHIDRLVEQFQESALVATLDANRAMVVASAEPTRSLRIGMPAGRLLPLHASAVGKVLMAFQPPERIEASLASLSLERLTANTVTDIDALRRALYAIRAAGYAVDNEEMEEGLRCVAVPVMGHQGKARAALSISAPASRIDEPRLKTYSAELMRCARQIGEGAGVESKVLPDKAAPRGSFPHLKRVGDFILISGTSARRPDDSFEGVYRAADGTVRLDIRAQTRATLDKIADMLTAVDAGLEDLVDLEAFLTDIADYPAFNEVYAGYLGPEGPSRTTVAVRALPHPHQLLMIRAWAYRPPH